MGAERLEILPIHFLRLLGYESTDETICAALPVGAIFVGSTGNNVGATIGRPLLAAGAMRLEILPIHLLRQHGYESAEETVAVRHRVGALKSCTIVGCAIAPAAAALLASP